MPVLFKTFLINNNAKIGLSECNLNNYHAILRKRDRGLIDAFDTSACPIIAQRPQKDNSEDEYYKNKTVAVLSVAAILCLSCLDTVPPLFYYGA